MKKFRDVASVALLIAPAALSSLSVGCGDYSAPGGTNAGTGGSGASGGSGGGGPLPPNTAPLPCTILQSANHPCVSAHSTVRVIVPGYTGPLYQVERPSDGLKQDIGSVDGYSDAATQEAFCGTENCVVRLIYDQSPQGNHLAEAPPGSAKPTPGNPAYAGALKVNINGRTVYGLSFRPGQGYRSACNECQYPESGVPGTARGDEPQTVYMVSSKEGLIDGCCFDYGNAEVTANNDGEGTMEAVYLGQGVIWGSGVDGGPWVMADLENGLYPGWEDGQWDDISTSTPLLYDFVTALIVGDTADKNGGKGRFAVYGGDAANGALKTMYDGIRPEKVGYVPMQKQGSVILSIGGDNSDGDGGRFYEGVMANGAATIETINALQAAIVAAGYGK